MGFRSYLDERKPFASKKNPRSAKQRRARVVPRTGGRLTKTERAIIAHVVQDTPGEMTREQVQSTAMMLRRNPRTVVQAIREAREELQQRAGKYIAIHLEAAEQALASGDYDTARKAAEYILDRLSARDESGRIERIIDKEDDQRQLPEIKIGIALGGLPPFKREDK
jgi:hypothetical protein